MATQIGIAIGDMNNMYPKTFLSVVEKYSRLKGGNEKKEHLTAKEMSQFIRG